MEDKKRKLKQINYVASSIGDPNIYPSLSYIAEKLNLVTPRTAKTLVNMFNEYNNYINRIYSLSDEMIMSKTQKLLTISLYRDEFLRRNDQLLKYKNIDENLHSRVRSYIIGRHNEEFRTNYVTGKRWKKKN